ncbi:MAG: mechanosensitive ion channel family protein [Desulfobulbaceae bacterium]|nr:mechanosensitive ion channel family protein [Desulfobulbaceae bacterium]
MLFSWVVGLNKVAHVCIDHFTRASKGVGQDLLFLLHKLSVLVVVIAGAFLLLDIWHISLTPLLASAGVAGIAIALAAKDTLANFFGGISLFLDKIYKVGDYIIIDDVGRGEVVSLGIRSTRILTRDDVLVTVPNSIMANSRIVNETAPSPRYRLKIPVGVAYGTDLDKVEDILLGIAGKSDDILAEPAPRARVRALADSSVNFELMVWVSDPRDRGMQIHQFLKAIHREFKNEGIGIPFPQLDVHIDK